MKQVKPQRTKNKGKRITLLGVIANGSTADARKLLQKYNYPDANSYEDLEFKLTKLYKDQEDKKELEKELATIHPHKNFILNYLAPDKPVESENEIIKEEMPIASFSTCDCGNPNCPSNFGGSCSSTKSNASGCGCSGADGSTEKTEKNNLTDKTLIIGASMVGLFTLGIISIFALTLNRK